MSRYFVNDPPVAVPEFDRVTTVSDTLPNVIYIRSKMDVETKGKVSSEMFTLGEGQTLEARLGANEMALLLHNIVRWEGPDFLGVPCTPENIRKLDPTEPHIALVLEEIANRNRPKPSPNEKSPAPNGSTNGGGESSKSPTSLTVVSGNGTSKSPLLNALAGHQTKSDD